MNGELFTGDLDIASARTRSQLVALLRTIHLRADRPSLRALEAQTRHDKTPLSKTVVSEMLKGARFPRKAVMISFLRTCGVPDDAMEPWHRAWERVAAGEQELSSSAAYTPVAEQDQLASGSKPLTLSTARQQADDPQMPMAGAQALRDATFAAPTEPGAKQLPNPASYTASSRAVHSPIVRRRELAAILRALRAEAGLTIEQVAERLLCSPSKVSRIETGSRSVAMRDIRDLCDLYRVIDPQRDYLAELARESRQQGWWQSYDLPYAAYVGLEADATSIDTFEVAVVPGILQTADYARAVLEGAVLEPSPEYIERNVAARLKRQQLLTEDDPPQLHAIIDEAVLWRIIGNPLIMKAQLNHIVEMSGRPNVDVQVIPYNAGAYLALGSSFTILELPSPIPGVIYSEGLFGRIYLEQPRDVERFQRVFWSLKSSAATGQESMVLIAKVTEELDRTI